MKRKSTSTDDPEQQLMEYLDTRNYSNINAYMLGVAPKACTPLQYAVDNNYEQPMLRAIQLGADITSYKGKPISWIQALDKLHNNSKIKDKLTVNDASNQLQKENYKIVAGRFVSVMNQKTLGKKLISIEQQLVNLFKLMQKLDLNKDFLNYLLNYLKNDQDTEPHIRSRQDYREITYFLKNGDKGGYKITIQRSKLTSPAEQQHTKSPQDQTHDTKKQKLTNGIDNTEEEKEEVEHDPANIDSQIATTNVHTTILHSPLKETIDSLQVLAGQGYVICLKTKKAIHQLVISIESGTPISNNDYKAALNLKVKIGRGDSASEISELLQNIQVLDKLSKNVCYDHSLLLLIQSEEYNILSQIISHSTHPTIMKMLIKRYKNIYNQSVDNHLCTNINKLLMLSKQLGQTFDEAAVQKFCNALKGDPGCTIEEEYAYDMQKLYDSAPQEIRKEWEEGDSYIDGGTSTHTSHSLPVNCGQSIESYLANLLNPQALQNTTQLTGDTSLGEWYNIN